MSELAKMNDLEWYRDVPRSIRMQTICGIALLIGAFGSFTYWSFSAPLAAAVISQGSFVATGENKKIQHLEGGIIREILINEGDHVEKGQPIIRLDETAALASEHQLILRRARLEAINARLLAESNDADDIDFPKHLREMRADAEIAAIVDGQVVNFRASRQKLQSDLQLLLSNKESYKHRAYGYDKQRLSMERQLKYLREEHAAKAKLLKKGLIRRTEVNAIKRAMADAEGQIARLAAEVAETETQIKKHEEQIAQTKASYRQTALDETQSIQAELDSVRELSTNAESTLKRATINAPVSGTIVRLYYHTTGGVIESGKTIVEILPTGVPLIIEAQVLRNDIDSVKIGQKAIVRLTALNQRTTPILNGEVYYVSADSLSDENNGAAREIYLARVSLPGSELGRIKGFSPTPGMPAEIMIQTRPRTFYEYITKPIIDSMNRAFREQ
jgi:HlyD family secretion protein